MAAEFSVYFHITPSQKAYIGITSQPVKKRWAANGARYLEKTKRGTFVHPAFANAILKYGWDNIEHIVFADGLTKKQAQNAEMLLISLFQTNKKAHGYNILAGGGVGRHGMKHSEASRQKMRKNWRLSDEGKQRIAEMRRNIVVSEDTRKKMSESHSKPVVCIETSIIYKSVVAASEATGAPAANISRCCKGTRKTASKLHWKYHKKEIGMP